MTARRLPVGPNFQNIWKRKIAIQRDKKIETLANPPSLLNCEDAELSTYNELLGMGRYSGSRFDHRRLYLVQFIKRRVLSLMVYATLNVAETLELVNICKALGMPPSHVAPQELLDEALKIVIRWLQEHGTREVSR